MKFGQILVCCMTNISNMFLVECWRLETSSRLFYDFVKMAIQQDLAIFNGWHIPFLIVLYSPFQKKWNTGILAYLVIEWLGQVAKLKRTWNLAPVLQIVQKITENYHPCLYLSTGQVWSLPESWFKRYIHKCTLSHAHCDVTDLVNLGMVRNTNTWISSERNIIFLRNKKNS